MVDIGTGPRPVMVLNGLPSPEHSNSSDNAFDLFGASASETSQAASGEQPTATQLIEVPEPMATWFKDMMEAKRTARRQINHANQEKLEQAQRTQETLDGQTPADFKRIYQAAFSAMKAQMQLVKEERDRLQEQLDAINVDQVIRQRDDLRAELDALTKNREEEVDKAYEAGKQLVLNAASGVRNGKRPRHI